MAFYTQADFAKLCGVDKAYISMYKKRRKIILSGEFIDDKQPQNAEFLRKCLEKKKNRSEKEPEITIERQNESPAAPRISDPALATSLPAPNISAPIENPTELLLKKLTAQKLQEEIESLRIKNQKLAGEVIPTELVKIIFAQHTKSIISEFKSEIEKYLLIFSKKRGLNMNETAELRAELIESINRAVNKAVDESAKNVESIKNEYSDKRGVGERK